MLISKRFLALILLSGLFMLPLSGCWNRRELETLAIVAGVGIDLGEEPGTFVVTAQIIKPEEIMNSSGGSGKEQGQGGAGNTVWVAEGTGRSPFEAIRNMVSVSTRKLYFPHNQVIVIGKEAAEQGISPLLDLFVRDPEPRLSAFVLIAEGEASEVLDTAVELSSVPALGIAQIVEAQRAQSVSPRVDLLGVSNRLLSKTTAPIASSVHVREVKGQKSVHVEGAAVFTGDKLVGGFNRDETRGMLWITDEIGSGTVQFDCPDGSSLVILEVIRSNTQSRLIERNGSATMQITVDVTANLGSQMCMQTLSESEMIAQLEKLGSEAIASSIMAAISKAKELQADVFGFGDQIHREFPKIWRELEPRWQQAFGELDIEVAVRTKVRRVSLTTRPLVPDK